MEDLVQPTSLEIGGVTIHPNVCFATLSSSRIPNTGPLSLFGLKQLQT